MIYHEISRQLGVPGIHAECEAINALPDADHYKLNLADTQHFEPISMLLLGSAIRRLRSRNDAHVLVEIVGRDDQQIQGHNYAQRMGFWWSIGESDTPPEPTRNPNGSTIPITRLDYSKLFRRAGGVDPIRGGLVSQSAAAAATALCGSDEQSALWNSLEYALREMFRNTFEHSGSDSLWYTASTRPTQDDVQLAILDEGCGIKHSLNNSNVYTLDSDHAAILLALKPGVSRSAGTKRTHEQELRLIEQFPGLNPKEWDNSGYGLTLTTELCRRAGQFMIASGSASVSYVSAEVRSEACHHGTALRLVLAPSRLPTAMDAIGLTGKPMTARVSRSLLSASQRLYLKDKYGQ